MGNIEQLIQRKEIRDKLQQASLTGFVIADLAENQIMLSDFARQMLCVDDESISFHKFVSLVDQEDRDRVTTGMSILASYGVFDSNFRINFAGRKVELRLRFDGVEHSDELGRICYGFIRMLNRHTSTPSSWQIINSQFRELCYWQQDVPQSLMLLLANKSYSEVVAEMLNSLIERFGADRACFFEYDWEAGTQNCICEILNPDVTFKGPDLPANLRADEFPWLNSRFEQGQGAVVNDTREMPSEAAIEQSMFEMQGISSIMVMPMYNKQGTWGHISMAYVRRMHRWTEMEIGWFKAITNLAMVCLELHYSNKEVRRERRQLRYLQKNMPVGLEVYDHTGLLIEQNNRAMAMLGFLDREDMLSHKINLFENTFIPIEKREALRRGEGIQHDFYFEQTPFSERFYPNTGGKTEYIGLTGTALLDDTQQITNYVTILADHTEIMRANARLREFEQMFSMISQFAEIGYFRANLLSPTSELYATDQWYANLNITSDYTYTVSSLVPDTVHPDDATTMGRFMTDAIRGTSTGEQHIEIRVRNADGSIKWLRSSVMVVEHDPAKGKVVLFGVNFDITGMKNVETALIEAKNKAEESDRLKSSFIANMSHEIRTPLNAIVGFSGIITSMSESEELQEYASIITRNNELLLELFSDMMDLSRIEAGIFDITMSNTDINELCEELVSRNRPRLHPGVELRFERPLAECHLLCDRGRIDKVLGNILCNALKFTSEGIIEVDYEVCREEGRQILEFRIADTGIGMTPEQAEACFNRFTKANSFVQGLGLGLYVCKMLAGKLGGNVSVESKEGAGSCFRFRVPVEPVEQPDEIADLDLAVTINGHKPVVLVAEDMKINYMLISKLLAPFYTIIIVENGEDAVKAHAEHAPDLILMDLKMPKMNGLRATELIRKRDTKTPIVAITAFAFDFDRKRAAESGCNYMITKPINPTQLCKIIRKFIVDGCYVPKKSVPDY